MGEDVLGVQRDATQVPVLLDEVEQLRGVGHPESQRACDVLLFLKWENHGHTHKDKIRRELVRAAGLRRREVKRKLGEGFLF